MRNFTNRASSIVSGMPLALAYSIDIPQMVCSSITPSSGSTR